MMPVSKAHEPAEGTRMYHKEIKFDLNIIMQM
jgi:hypothetical protein